MWIDWAWLGGSPVGLMSLQSGGGHGWRLPEAQLRHSGPVGLSASPCFLRASALMQTRHAVFPTRWLGFHLGFPMAHTWKLSGLPKC